MEIILGVVKKIPIKYGYTSLIWAGEERPARWGNYFTMKFHDKSYRVMNMWYENLKSADERFGLNGEVQVVLYDRHLLIFDARIPPDWYYNKFYDLNMGDIPIEAAEEALSIMGDEESLDYWTDRVAHYARHGKEYNPKTGIVLARLPSGKVFDTKKET